MKHSKMILVEWESEDDVANRIIRQSLDRHGEEVLETILTTDQGNIRYPSVLVGDSKTIVEPLLDHLADC